MKKRKLLSLMLAFAMTASPLTVLSAAAENTTITPSNNSGQLTITLKIKQDLTPTVKLENWAYGSEANEPTVEGNLGNGAVTYSYKAQGADDSTYKDTKPTAVGKYTVKAEIAETDDYKGGSATADFEITPMTKGLTITLVIHEWGEIEYTWAQENGVWKCTATKPCLDDHNFDVTETVTAASEVTTPALCEEKGKTTYTAKFENPAFETQTKTVTDIEALGHKFINFWKWVWDGFNKAVAWLFCDNDPEHTETRDVPSTIDTIDEPSCTEDGYIYHVATIDVAGKIYTTVNVETKDQLGHDWGEPTYTWSNDNSECTATRVCGNDANHVETETADTAYKVITEPTCEDKGIGEYTATFDNAAFGTQTKTVDIEPTGHKWLHSGWYWNFFDDDGNRLDMPESAVIFYCDNNNDHELRVPATVTKSETDTMTVYTAVAEFEGETYTTTAEIPKEISPDTDSEKMSDTDSEKPSDTDSEKPSDTDSEKPSDTDSEKPSDTDSEKPSDTDSEKPSDTDSEKPSDTDSEKLSDTDSEKPSDTDSEKPSDTDSEKPSDTDSEKPSDTDSEKPSDTDSEKPSDTDSEKPSDTDSEKPSDTDSEKPSDTDSEKPSDTDSEKPSDTDSEKPSDTDSEKPSDTDSEKPSDTDSEKPYDTDSEKPSDTDTDNEYILVNKEDTTWKPGDGALTLYIKCIDGKSAIDKLTGITVNGKTIPASSYTVTETQDGIAITFAPEVFTQLSDGKYTITVNFSDGSVEKEITIESESEQIEVGLLGDVNGDGVVDSADALAILRASVNLETFSEDQKLLGDVNGDGKVDSVDALSVLRFSVNLIDNDNISKPVTKTA